MGAIYTVYRGGFYFLAKYFLLGCIFESWLENVCACDLLAGIVFHQDFLLNYCACACVCVCVGVRKIVEAGFDLLRP